MKRPGSVLSKPQVDLRGRKSKKDEENNMKYTKPCILAEKQAVSTIQSTIVKGSPEAVDNMNQFATTPAYEADE
jgi:hypothetical protein